MSSSCTAGGEAKVLLLAAQPGRLTAAPSSGTEIVRAQFISAQRFNSSTFKEVLYFEPFPGKADTVIGPAGQQQVEGGARQ